MKMKVSGFTIIRNAILYDYPVIESILSILPIVDEFIVAVGQSNDATLDLIRSIESTKIHILETTWDDSLRQGGQVLANETDKAYHAISKDSDWAFYIQSDEIVHEKYLDDIHAQMEMYRTHHNVQGLLLKYKHFYGSYDYIGSSRRWYRNEIRIIRNLPEIHSYRDAQGFRIGERKLNVKAINAEIYHYGWVKPPKIQQLKQKTFNKLWHNDSWVEQNIPDVDSFDYSRIDTLALFKGTHPRVMQKRIQKMNWHFSFDPTQKKLSLKNRLLEGIEKRTGYRIGEYKNYHLI